MPVKQILGGTFEFIKDTAKQGAKIAPDVLGGMLEQAVKGGQQTPAQQQQAAQQQMQKQQQVAAEHKEKDEEDLAKTRAALAQMKRMQREYAPKAQQGPRPYEQTIQDLEQKKAREAEALQLQRGRNLPAMSQKAAPGGLGKKRVNKGSEGMVKDSKVG